MQLAQLHMVKQILETGSLSKTAARLNWAQSVVSRQLAALERECGGRIFYRNGRGVLLTELGERILPQIDLIISAAEDITSCGAKLRNELSGEVSVAVSPQLAPCLSGPLFSKLKQKHPNIRLSVWEAYSDTIKAEVQEGRTDIAVFMSGGTTMGIDDRVICELDSYLVGTADSAATREEIVPFSQLGGLPLLLPSMPNAWRKSFDAVASSRGITLSIAAEVNAPGPTAALVHAGAGYLISPLVAGPAAARMGWIGADVHAGRLSAARIVDPGFTCKLVVSTGANRRRPVEAVARLIEAMLRDLMKTDPDSTAQPFAPKERALEQGLLAS